MQRNENHFGRVTFVRACYHHHYHYSRRRRRRVAQRYETRRAARGLGDATVTPTDLKPVRPAVGVGRIRRLDVIDPNRSRPTPPPLPPHRTAGPTTTVWRTCVRQRNRFFRPARARRPPTVISPPPPRPTVPTSAVTRFFFIFTGKYCRRRAMFAGTGRWRGTYSRRPRRQHSNGSQNAARSTILL